MPDLALLPPSRPHGMRVELPEPIVAHGMEMTEDYTTPASNAGALVKVFVALDGRQGVVASGAQRSFCADILNAEEWARRHVGTRASLPILRDSSAAVLTTSSAGVSGSAQV
ncbi:hypothetical protein JCM11641_008401 [Rhodosporidiobolus odoratus]